ncbi:MAG: AmmeMemoRadiSam system protein B [Candidatus Omnitrophica bacterium]|nr:AmmeMemoRadiSam system protein B [Candidatus Omnitrophota bacterium]
MAEVRAPQVAGQFYPADPKELRETVDGAMAAAGEIRLEGEPVALLSPHAGYAFSGSVQGYSYRPLQGVSFDTVVVLGTGHYFPTETGSVFDGVSYQTPLGEMKIDSEFVSDLLKLSPLFQANQKAHQREHSVETQVPFLQRALGSAQIVPIVMGNPPAAVCRQMGEALARLIQKQRDRGKKTLLIVSSDLSHYPSDQDARTVDSSTLQALLTMNPDYFSQVNAHWMRQGVPHLSCVYCGEGAVTTVMAAAKELGADQTRLLRYATSAEVPYGDLSRVVGYAAVVFIKGNEKREEQFVVSEETRKVLLQMARNAIAQRVGAGLKPVPTIEDPILKRPAAVFITLKKNGQLRGCIGGTEARMPLGEAVPYFAAAAAFDDPRFSPLQQEELEDTHIEISVLSPLKRIRSAVEILPAVHGVVVRRGARSGLFLPQVWLETGWTKEVFLDQLCAQKGGLAARSWQDPQTELYIFTVFSFEEIERVG